MGIKLVCFAEPMLDNCCCCLEVMTLERRVLVLAIENVGRKLLVYTYAHGMLEDIMIANGRVLFVTPVHETSVPVGRLRPLQTVFTDWRQRILLDNRPRNFNTYWMQWTPRRLIIRAFCSLLTLDACGISR